MLTTNTSFSVIIDSVLFIINTFMKSEGMEPNGQVKYTFDRNNITVCIPYVYKYMDQDEIKNIENEFIFYVDELGVRLPLYDYSENSIAYKEQKLFETKFNNYLIKFCSEHNLN